MKLVKLNSEGSAVKKLQFYLNQAGHPLIESGIFDMLTDQAVKKFQTEEGLGVDGIVGNNTWKALLKKVYTDDFFSHNIINQILESEEFYTDRHPKTAIYLHHTAGNYNPKSTLRWWNMDNYKDGSARHISTAFVIGRKSSLKGKPNEEYDGVIYRAFNETMWAHHLGYSKAIDKTTIGIEICAFGWLYKDEEGYYYQANKKQNTKKVYIEDDGVHEFETPWRGQKYFEKYTEKQIAETKRLILTLAFLFDIELPNTQYNREWFELNQDALDGKPGLWVHVNVRKDKTDCFPQPELIDMLNSLHEEQKTFVPTLKTPEVETIDVVADVVADVVSADTVVDTVSEADPVVVVDKSISFTTKGVNDGYSMEDLFRPSDL